MPHTFRCCVARGRGHPGLHPVPAKHVATAMCRRDIRAFRIKASAVDYPPYWIKTQALSGPRHIACNIMHCSLLRQARAVDG
eukprot:1547279-Pleurochrysis_carterae.AAC.1